MAQGPQGVSIDLRQFNDRAAKGSVSVQRLGPKSFQMIVRNFDPADGKEQEPSIVPVNIEGLDMSIQQTDLQIKELEAAKASMQQLRDHMQGMEDQGLSIHDARKPEPPASAGQPNQPAQPQ